MIQALFVGTAIYAAPPPQPTITLPSLPPQGQAAPVHELLSWSASEIRCDDQPVQAIALAPVRPLVVHVFGLGPQPVTMNFSIDTSGRAHAISETREQYGHDLSPALAASRFRTGSPRSACTLLFRPQRYAIVDAPMDLLISSTIKVMGARTPKQIWDRIYADGDCRTEPKPKALVQAFPHFRAISPTPGQLSWSLIGYDLDSRGKPAAVKVRAATGNAELDDASVKAVKDSRFDSGPRTGCQTHFWRDAGKIPAPENPDKERFALPDATCPTELRWDKAPQPAYPANFRERAIEGWAIVAFDLAPWGAAGNMRVLQSEPSDAFGSAALRALQIAKVAPSSTGASGCIERIHFKMESEGAIP